jgi:hypothetical protein
MGTKLAAKERRDAIEGRRQSDVPTTNSREVR